MIEYLLNGKEKSNFKVHFKNFVNKKKIIKIMQNLCIFTHCYIHKTRNYSRSRMFEKKQKSFQKYYLWYKIMQLDN